ncbi:hypothetical protein Tco_1216346 [Tanacetum coccineum]
MNEEVKMIQESHPFMEAMKRIVVRLPDPKLKTLGDRGKDCIFIGYVEHSKAFRSGRHHKGVLLSKVLYDGHGEADVILGITIKHESNGISISQSHYIENVLKKFNYFDCTPMSTPMDTSEKLKPNNGQALSQLEYSRMIGYLMYVMTCTRPDIAFVVGKLSRYTSNLSTQHWQAVQRVLKYLKNTMDYSLSYTRYLSILEGYTDASWINNMEDSSSTSGWVFLLGGATLAKSYSQMYNGKSRHLDQLTKGLARDLVIKSAKGMGLKSNLGTRAHVFTYHPKDVLRPTEGRMKGFLLNSSFEKVHGICMNKGTTYVNVKFCCFIEL